MNEYARYLDDVKYHDVVNRVVEHFNRHPDLRPQEAKCRLPVAMMVEVALVHLCHNLPQSLLAGLYGVSQSTVSRVIRRIRPALTAALSGFRPEIDDLADGLAAVVSEATRIGDIAPLVLIDGTLVRESWRKGNREVYSGKHRAAGRNVQVVTDETGRILYASTPQLGRTHDRRAVTETGIEAAIIASGVVAYVDKGYAGTLFVHQAKRSKYHPLAMAQVVENRWINRFRSPVERGIAHLKGALRILRTGIRTRGSDRNATVIETINLAVSLYFYRRDWRPEVVRA